MLLLNGEDVRSLLTMRDAIRVTETSFGAFSRNESTTPQRLVIPIPQAEGMSVFMPSYLHNSALAVKVASVFKHNPARHNLPSITGVILLLDDETGAPLALMDAAYLTAVRTGAASGVATKYLARPESRVVGCLGSSIQALTQLWAVCESRDIEVVKVYSPHIQARIATLQEEMKGLVPAQVVAVSCAEDAIRGSDIVILATNATEPIVDGAWFEKSAHINAIGSHAPRVRELDTTSLLRSTVICDSTTACLTEAGDLRIPIEEGHWTADRIHGDLGEIVNGDKPGRWQDEQITLFKSVGLAFQDAAMAKFVYEQALTNGVGEPFDVMSLGATRFLPSAVGE